MLRINPARFLIGDVEKRCVKIRDVIQEPAFASVHFPRLAIRAIKLIHVPAIGWNLAHRIDAVHQVVPKLVNIVRAGKPTTHSDDRHVFANPHRLLSRIRRSSRFCFRVAV